MVRQDSLMDRIGIGLLNGRYDHVHSTARYFYSSY